MWACTCVCVRVCVDVCSCMCAPWVRMRRHPSGFSKQCQKHEGKTEKCSSENRVGITWLSGKKFRRSLVMGNPVRRGEEHDPGGRAGHAAVWHQQAPRWSPQPLLLWAAFVRAQQGFQRQCEVFTSPVSRHCFTHLWRDKLMGRLTYFRVRSGLPIVKLKLPF